MKGTKHYEWGGPAGQDNNWHYAHLWIQDDGLHTTMSTFAGRASRQPESNDCGRDDFTRLGFELETEIIGLLKRERFPEAEAELRALYERSIEYRFQGMRFDKAYLMGRIA